jgi:acyl-coenzyme A synthetase/AMP-(fatty) acid ligase
VKLLTRRRKPAAVVHNGAYDAAAVMPALAEGRWAVPDRFNFARDVVEVLARDPKRRALTFLGKDGVIEPRSFLRISENAAKWATLMRENGVEPGDRVLVLSGKTPEWLEVMLAAMKVGAVSVPCPETMSAAALGIRISGSDAKLVVASEAARDEVERIAAAPPVLYVEEMRTLARNLPDEAPTHDTSSRDAAFVLTTSGTANGPRGVTHTHGSAFAARVQAEHWLDAGPHDGVWCTADASTGLAVWNALLGPWSRGAEIILHQEPFDPQERLDCIRRLDATILCQTPAEYKALLSVGDITRYRAPKLRRLASTGEHLSPDVIGAYEEAWGLTICDAYGQVETGVVVANGAGAGFQAGSVGLPLPGFDVAVIDDQGNEVEPGVVGDLAVRGRPPALFSGYWNAPDETKAAFRGDTYVTGDTAASDEDGFIWLLGRSSDVILTGGGRFGPIEVEEALEHHAAVADAAVVGMRDLQRGGQFVRAFVVLEPGNEPSDRLVAEIREHSRHTLDEHKVPREIDFVEALPMTADGKIKRLDLRERPVVGLAPVWSPASAPALAPEPPTEPTPAPEPEALATVEPNSAVVAPVDVALESTVETPAEPAEWPPVFEEPRAEPSPPAPFVESALDAVEVEPVPTPEPELFVEPEPAPPAPVLEPEPSEEPVAAASLVEEPVVEAAPEHEPEPEPEPVLEPEAVFEPEPEAVVEPEPELVLEQNLDPTPVVEASAPEPVVLEPVVLEPVAAEPVILEPVEAEPVILEPVEAEQVVIEPEDFEPDLLEPVASGFSVLEPLRPPEPEPTPEPEPPVEPAPAAVSEPEAEAEPVVDDLADLIVTPDSPREPEPEQQPEHVAEVIPLVDTTSEPDPAELPDFVVVPGSEGRQGDPPTDSMGLGFPPVTELILDRDVEHAPAQERDAKPRREREAADRRGGKDRRRRSNHEPGDESDETDWMQGLSNRLSAYSLSEEENGSNEPDSGS